jgi:hypothetical protein
MTGFSDPITGGGILVQPEIRSPNFVHGVSGWIIRADGTAEFQSVIVPSGSGGARIFVQSGAPASPNTGDLWVQTSSGNEVAQWSGSAWVSFQWGTGSIQANAITAALIAANTITAAQIAANTITAAQIAANTITAGQIAAATITATQIAAGAITTTQLAANAVTAAKIAANTITAAQLAAGIVYATIVDGTTITGAQIVADGSSGEILVYSGAPALGNLIGSWSAVAGTDGFTNAFRSGFVAGNSAFPLINLDPSGIARWYNTSGLDVININANKEAAYFYNSSGTAAGNLICVIASVAGSDPNGNAYPVGFTAFPANDTYGLNVGTGTFLGPLLAWVTNGTDAPFTDASVGGQSSKASGCLVIVNSGQSLSGSTESAVEVLDNVAALASQGISQAFVDVVADVTGLTGASGSRAPVLIFGPGATPSAPATLGVPGLFNGSVTEGVAAVAQQWPSGLTAVLSASKQANANTANVGTTANSSLGFMTVPANDVVAGSSYEGHASGSFSTGASPPASATFRVYWGGTGGTAIAALAVPAVPANAAGQPWYMDFEANWQSTTAVEVTLRVGWHNGTGVANSVTVFTVSNTTGLTTTSSENLSMAFQWGSAPGGQQLLCDVSRLGKIV